MLAQVLKPYRLSISNLNENLYMLRMGTKQKKKKIILHVRKSNKNIVNKIKKLVRQAMGFLQQTNEESKIFT